MPVETKNHHRVRNVTIPGHTVYTQDYVQPIYNKEETELRFTDSPAVNHPEKVVTLPV